MKPRWLCLWLMLAGGAVHPAAGLCDADDGAAPLPGAAASDTPLPGAAAADTPATDTPADASQPRLTLSALVDRAIRRNHGAGAARLLAAAAAAEVEEARAAALPQLGLFASAGPSTHSGSEVRTSSRVEARAGLNLSAPLYDAGRIDGLTGWRRNLAEAARQGQISTEEAIGLQTVSLALERSRYGMQAVVYRQYARRIGCLVEALQQIVSADRGRGSELVQAQKTLQQVELSRVDTATQLRQSETRLRRFVGDALPPPASLAAVLVAVPPLDDLLADAGRGSEIAQLEAQADALDSYADAVDAARKPQLDWVVTGSKAIGRGGNPSALIAGVNLNVPLYDPVIRHSAEAARRRAGAARLQRADALEARRSRIVETHQQALASFERARSISRVVADSGRVRDSTVQQWQQIGRRSLFDVIAAESDYYGLRIAQLNALYDGEQSTALLRSFGPGIAIWLR